MSTRRRFLQTSASLAAAGCLLHETPARAAETLTYGVQMFMVRKQAASDLPGALRSIKEAGFPSVELYPIAYHQPAAQLRRLLAETGLTSVAGHFDYTSATLPPAAAVDYAHTLGLKYLVCPMLPHELWTSLDGFRQAAAYFNQWGELARKAGIQFVFHNHCYEFKPLQGSDGWTELMHGTDAGLVKLELDLFWLATGGQDPAAMLRKYADRTVLVHLKDRTAGAPVSYVPDAAATSYCTELGKGAIDWPGLLGQAQRQGIRYAFLDQDDTKIPVPASMRESRRYLGRLGAR